LVLLTIRELRELVGGVERMPNFADSMPGEISPPADRPFLPWVHFPVPDPGSLMVYLRRLFPGCGSGEVATHMALHFAASRVSAIDWQKPALSYGTRRALKLGVENIEFSAGDAMSVGAGEQRFQFIDARDAMHEFPAALLAALAKLLVPGGLLRLDVAGRDHAEIVRVAFELGASQAQGSLQFARRDIAQSGHEACQYLWRQESFYDLSRCLELISMAEWGGIGADDLLSVMPNVGLKLVGQIAPTDLRVRYHMANPEDPKMANLVNYETFMRQNLEECGGKFRLLLEKSE
jgi:ubiquinone/menaquinone biosynthesis C-methylase UbiE